MLSVAIDPAPGDVLFADESLIAKALGSAAGSSSDIGEPRRLRHSDHPRLTG